MFGGSFSADLTAGKAVLVVWLCDCRCFRGRFCPIATSASWASCFGQPEISGGTAQPGAAFEYQPAPAFSRVHRGHDEGFMTGPVRMIPYTGGDHAGRPGSPCWHRPCRPIPAHAFAPLIMGIEPRGLPARCAGVVRTLSMKLSSFRAPSGRVKPLDLTLYPSVRFESFLTHRACASAL